MGRHGVNKKVHKAVCRNCGKNVLIRTNRAECTCLDCREKRMRDYSRRRYRANPALYQKRTLGVPRDDIRGLIGCVLSDGRSHYLVISENVLRTHKYGNPEPVLLENPDAGLLKTLKVRASMTCRELSRAWGVAV